MVNEAARGFTSPTLSYYSATVRRWAHTHKLHANVGDPRQTTFPGNAALQAVAREPSGNPSQFGNPTTSMAAGEAVTGAELEKPRRDRDRGSTSIVAGKPTPAQRGAAAC